MRDLLLALLMAALLWPAAARTDGVSRALLIGCDLFLTEEDTAPSSRNNVLQMAETLRQGRAEPSSLILRPEGISGEAELDALITEAFGGARAGDVSYFYISTHGRWSPGDDNAAMTLLLSDGEHEAGLTAARLREMLDRVPGVKVLLIDACHSGAMIGKGVSAPFDNLFTGPDYKVICSSGGAEESWFWSGYEETQTRLNGAGYFSGALQRGLSAENGRAADTNRDGEITLSELKRFLRQQHGASTVQTYPEEDDFPVFRYDPEQEDERGAALRGLHFEGSLLTPEDAGLALSFTVTRPVRVGYQVVLQQGGRWDFDHASVQFDDEERFGAWGDTPGLLSPGLRDRVIVLRPGEAEEPPSGYALVQVLTLDRGEVAIAASCVVCVPAGEGDPELAITAVAEFTPDRGGEAVAAVAHSLPCALTVTVEDAEGAVVRRLMTDEPSRPEQQNPTATTVVWNGRLADGTMAPAGEYRLHARTEIGGVRYEAWSAPILLRSGEEEHDGSTD